MRRRYFYLAGALVGIAWLASVSAAGQAPTAQAQAYSPPRTPDGQPDMQGFFAAPIGGSYSIEELELQIQASDFQGAQLQGLDERERALREERRRLNSRIVDPPDGRIPYQPWARARQEDTAANHLDPKKPEHLDPRARCFQNGVPRFMHLGQFQIIQPPGYVVLLYEDNHAYRIIPTDGRPHVGENMQLWAADSRGRWEGTTLVVDVTNFNDIARFDVVGNFHSAAVHIVERFTLVDADTINYRATVEDPTVYTRPWTMAVVLKRLPESKQEDYQLLESACFEGNRSTLQTLDDARFGR